ncbi:hypothetical protein [Nostoc sp. CCY 9925]|uniref:hypothetical protein n=1 Tax=Nostoc sp. CCY 9925 TaxID=3103865 RepID=UPI0039C7097F
MYLAVEIAGKLYTVHARTYKSAIAQAVGQAVAEGLQVNKTTPIELVLVDGAPIEVVEEIIQSYKNSNLK